MNLNLLSFTFLFLVVERLALYANMVYQVFPHPLISAPNAQLLEHCFEPYRGTCRYLSKQWLSLSRILKPIQFVLRALDGMPTDTLCTAFYIPVDHVFS